MISQSDQVLLDVGYSPTISPLVTSGVIEYVRQHHRLWRVHAESGPVEPSLRSGQFDGAIVFVRSHPKLRALARRLHGLKRPIVNIMHDMHALLPSVLADDHAFGQVGATYLMGLGYPHHAFAGIDSQWSMARQAGFSHAMKQAGRTWHPIRSTLDVSDYLELNDRRVRKDLEQRIRQLPRPIAVMACNDMEAAVVISVCLAVGLRVPEDVAVLGVDNDSLLCEQAAVPISSIEQDFRRLGFEAAKLLDSLMLDVKPPGRPVLLPPGRLIARRSTDAFAFEDENVSAALRLIHLHAGTGTTIKRILKDVPVSRTWLHHQFKALLGQTPGQLIRQIRLERVREMLAQTNLPVEQIAARCGFSRSQNLSRFFRERYGLSPREFRKRNGSNDSPRSKPTR